MLLWNGMDGQSSSVMYRMRRLLYGDGPLNYCSTLRPRRSMSSTRTSITEAVRSWLRSSFRRNARQIEAQQKYLSAIGYAGRTGLRQRVRRPKRPAPL